MKRKILTIMLLASMMLSACSSAAGQKSEPAQTGQTEGEQTQEAVDGAQADGATDTGAATDTAISDAGSAGDAVDSGSHEELFDVPLLRKGTYYDYIDTYSENMEGEYKSFGKIQVDYYEVYNDGYEALAQALEDDFKERKEASSWYQSVVRESISYMDELDETTGMPWPYEDKLNLVRADDDVISYMSNAYSYTGGAHGGTTIAGATFDVQTGKKLALKDVVSDFDEFYDVVYKMLEEDQEDFFEEWRDTVHRDLYEDSAENGAFAWVLGPDYIRVTFGDYELGAFALGHVSKEVRAADHPGLIKSEYVADGKAVCDEMLSYESVFKDIDGDGEDEEISLEVIPEYDETDDYVMNNEIKVNVTKNGKTMTATNKNGDGYGDDLDFEEAYLMETDGGYFYLVAGTSSYNDWESLDVFDLNDESGPRLIGRTSTGALYGFVPMDPDHVVLSTRIDVMGTYGVHRECYLSDEGEFIPYDDEYRVTYIDYTKYDDEVGDEEEIRDADSSDASKPAGSPDTEVGSSDEYDPYSLLTTADIEAYTDKDKSGNVTIPSGTRLHPVRSDGEDYMIFDLPDGSEACIYYDMERDPDVFERIINGKPESELFEMLPYAG